MTKIHLLLLVATLFVSPAVAGDLVEVFGIARCPDTSKFVKNQLVPFYEQFNANFSTDFKLDFHSVPTGGSEVNGRYVNKCLHGAVECALNKLQMCARKHIENDWMAVAGCVQGLKAYSEGVKCLPDTQEGQKVKQCAESEEGEYLLNDENSYRYNVAPGSSWLPWIQVNGVRNRDAEFHLKKVVCGLESMKDNGICK